MKRKKKKKQKQKEEEEEKKGKKIFTRIVLQRFIYCHLLTKKHLLRRIEKNHLQTAQHRPFAKLRLIQSVTTKSYLNPYQTAVFT